MTGDQTQGKSKFGKFCSKRFVWLQEDTRWASGEDGTSWVVYSPAFVKNGASEVNASPRLVVDL